MWDSPHPFINEAWCMAKIKRLFPHWEVPHSDNVEGHSLKAAVDAASSFSKEVSELQAISPLCEELRKVDMPRQFRDLLRLMLVVDPVQRPSASSVLASEEFRALEELVSRWIGWDWEEFTWSDILILSGYNQSHCQFFYRHCLMYFCLLVFAPVIDPLFL